MNAPPADRRQRWETLFGQGDPWDFHADAYEQAKYLACLDLLAPRHCRGLEIGCANGAFTRHLATRCDRLLALDLSEAALAQARARGTPPGVTFARAELPGGWPEGRFDLIVLSEVLYYFRPPEIAELARLCAACLAPGGRVLLVNWLGETGEPLSGAEAADAFLGALPEGALRHSAGPAGRPYRTDLLSAPEAPCPGRESR